MKKLLILLFSLTLFGLNAQTKQTKKPKQTRKQKKAALKNEKGLKEFVPSASQYEKNRNKNTRVNSDDKKAVVLPTFEGAINLVNTDPNGLTGKFLVEGKQVAAEIPGPMKTELKYLIQNDKATEIHLTKQQGKKLAIKQRRVALKMPKGLAPSPIDKGKMIVTKTGKTESIAGYNCHEVVVKDNTTQLTAWVTTEVPVNFKDIMPTIVTAASYLNKVNSNDGIKNALIIRATQKDLKSGKSFTLTSNVEKKKIKDKAFKIPSGYRLVDQTRMSTRVRSISPGASVGAAQNKAKAAMKQMEAAKKAGAKEADPAAAPVKE